MSPARRRPGVPANISLLPLPLLLLLLALCSHCSSSAAASASLSPSPSLSWSVSRIPHLESEWESRLSCPRPLRTTASAVADSTSPCWWLEWLPMFAAHLQPRLRGTARMRGNWSSVASAAMRRFQLQHGLTERCQQLQLLYPPAAFHQHERPAAAQPQDRLGGLPSVLLYVDAAAGGESGSADGSVSSPFASIAAALSVARSLPASTHKSIVLRGGLYHAAAPLLLDERDVNLAIVGQPGEDVVWSGTTAFAPDWRPAAQGGGVYVAAVPASVSVAWSDFNELFVDGGRQSRARWPNGNASVNVAGDGSWSSAFSWLGTSASPPAAEVRIANVRNTSSFADFQMGYNGSASVFSPPQSYWSVRHPSGGAAATHVLPTSLRLQPGFSPRVGNYSRVEHSYLHAIHCYGWGSWQFRLASVDAATGVVGLGAGGFQESRGCSTSNCSQCDYALAYIDHQLAELDAPGEWYLDSDARLLYYLPLTAGAPPQQVEASQTPTLIWLQGGHNISIQGITFQHTANSFMQPHAATEGGDWANTAVAAIRISDCSNCSVTNCLLTQLGGNAVGVDGAANGTVIAYNEISHTGANAVAVMGSIAGWDAAVEWRQPRDSLILSNLMTDVGQYNKESGFVHITLSYRTVVDSNVMSRAPRTGVNVQGGFGGGHVISNNEVTDTSRETEDVGPINSWNRVPYRTLNAQSGDYSWETSVSYVHHNLLLCDNHCETGTGFGNSVLDHDDGTTTFHDYDNVFLNSRTHTNLGSRNAVYRNLVLPAAYYACYWYPSTAPTDSNFANRCLHLHYPGSGFPYGATVDPYWSLPSDALQLIAAAFDNDFFLPANVSLQSDYIALLNASSRGEQEVGYSLPQFQSLCRLNSSLLPHCEQRSRVRHLPTSWPFYSRWGPQKLGFDGDACNRRREKERTS